MMASVRCRVGPVLAGAVRGAVRGAEAAAAGRRAAAVVHGGSTSCSSRQAFLPAGGRRQLSGVAFQIDPPEETVWPTQRVEEGVSYELNWSICGSGVVPLGKAFRNMRLPELALCHSADCSEQVSNNRQRMVARMNPLYTMLHAYQSK